MAGRSLLFAAALLALYVCLPSVVSSPIGDARTSSAARAATHGAVASESRFCSGYGGDMLEKGGNAADAVS
jgi:gamma-glutamyltranspeptidase